MNKLLSFSLLFILLSSGSTVAQTTKKYDLKSGVITFETNATMMGTDVKMKYLIYFDDYVMKECKETLNDDGTVKEWFLSDGKDLILVLFEKKEAYKRGKAYRGTEMPFVWNQVSEKDNKKAGKYKKVPNVTILGKNCEAFEMNDGGDKTIFAGWNHIVLSMEINSKGMKSTQKATKIEENVAVPADKFSIPSGYKVQ